MQRKQIFWISSSKKEGYGLHVAQLGDKHENTKPLKEFGSADVLEIVDEDSSGTYRAIYTVRFKDAIFVLHAFQKKSKQGIKTPKQDIDLIHNRLKQAQELYKEFFNKSGKL